MEPGGDLVEDSGGDSKNSLADESGTADDCGGDLAVDSGGDLAGRLLAGTAGDPDPGADDRGGDLGVDSGGDLAGRLLAGTAGDPRRATLARTAGDPGQSQKELGGLWRGRLDGRLWRWPARTGEDVAATVTHHSDVPVTLPNIATSVRLVQHGEGEEAEVWGLGGIEASGSLGA